jgi:hypothetical protein
MRAECAVRIAADGREEGAKGPVQVGFDDRVPVPIRFPKHNTISVFLPILPRTSMEFFLTLVGTE